MEKRYKFSYLNSYWP